MLRRFGHSYKTTAQILDEMTLEAGRQVCALSHREEVFGRTVRHVARNNGFDVLSNFGGVVMVRGLTVDANP